MFPPRSSTSHGREASSSSRGDFAGWNSNPAPKSIPPNVAKQVTFRRGNRMLRIARIVTAVSFGTVAVSLVALTIGYIAVSAAVADDWPDL